MGVLLFYSNGRWARSSEVGFDSLQIQGSSGLMQVVTR